MYIYIYIYILFVCNISYDVIIIACRAARGARRKGAAKKWGVASAVDILR